MARIKKNKADTGGFPEKYYKVLMGSGIMEDMDASDEEALRKSVIESETSIEEQDQLKEADEKLKVAREDAKTLGGAYKDATKFQNAKIKYALLCLDRMGKL
ncbi:MAG: hypothetical protein ACOYMA_00180 [Bacteroidia bacterium]